MADDNLGNDQISVKDDSPEQEPTKLQKRRTKMLNNTTKLVPGRLNVQKGTNFRKLFRVLNFSLFGTKRLVNRVDQWRSISKAKGKALDAIGEDWGVYRNGSDDDFYRFLIRFKQSQSRADGSVNSLIKVISDALGADPKDISIKNFTNEPQTIVVDNIPNKYIDTDDKTRMIIKQIENSVAAGISIAGIHFTDQTNLTIYPATYVGMFTSYVIPAWEDVTVSQFELPMQSYPAVYGQVFQHYQVATAEDVTVYQHDTTTPAYIGQAVSHFKKYTINGKE